MKLGVNGKFTQSKSPGLIPVQPKDGLDVGFDDQSAAGDYATPNPFNATILSAKVKTGCVIDTRIALANANASVVVQWP